MAVITFGAGAGNWETNASWVGGTKPGAGDDALFTVASGNVTIGAASVCRSADFTGYTGTFSHGAFTLTIGTTTAQVSNVALKFVTGMTYSNTGGTTAFTSTVASTTQTVDFAGKSTGSVSFSAATTSGYQYVNGGAVGTVHTAAGNSSVTHTQGSLDLNGQTVSWNTFVSSNGNTRSLTFGAATVTMTGANTTVWSLANTTGLSVTANTSAITCSGAGAIWNVAGTSGSSKTFNNLTMSGSGIVQVLGTASFNNLTITNTASKTDSCLIGGNQTITGTLTITGNSLTNRHFILSSVLGTANTLTVSNPPSLSNVDFQDITASGSTPWTGASLGDCLGNSGITFTTNTGTSNGGTGVNRYWVGNANNSLWSATTSWSTSSGGSSGATVPLAQDTVIFDNSSLSTNRTGIQFDMRNMCVSFQMSAMTSWTINCARPAASFKCNFYGLVDMSRITTISTSNWLPVILCGRGSHNFTPPTGTLNGQIQILSAGGTFTQQTALLMGTTVNDTFLLFQGTYNANNFNTSTGKTDIGGSSQTATRSLTMGTGIWTCAGTTTVWTAVTTTGLTLNSTGSTIAITDVSATGKTFAGGGLTYNIVTYTVAGSTGSLIVSGSNTFDTFSFSDVTNARTLSLTNATTQTINNLNINGTSGKLMTISSTTGGSTTTALQKGGTGVWSCDYLTVTDVKVNNAYTFYAGANSSAGGTSLNVHATAPDTIQRRQSMATTGLAVSTISANYPFTTVSGNLLALALSFTSAPGTLTPPTGWTQAVTTTNTVVNYLFYKIADGTETSVSASWTNTPNVEFFAWEFSGFTGTPVLDVTDSNNSAGAVTTLSTNGSSPSNSVATALAIASVNMNSTTSAPTSTNSYDIEYTAASTRMVPAVKPLSVTAAQSTTISWTTARTAAATLVVFKGTAGGATLMMMGI